MEEFDGASAPIDFSGWTAEEIQDYAEDLRYQVLRDEGYGD
jgi:hypothetical protein